MYYFYYLSSHFESFSPVVRLTVFLTMLLGGVYIYSLLRIGAVAYRNKVEKQRYSKVKEKYEILCKVYRILLKKAKKQNNLKKKKEFLILCRSRVVAIIFNFNKRW